MSALSNASATPSDPNLAKFARFGLTATYEPMYPIANLSADKRVQVRDSMKGDVFAPKTEVDKYADLMAGGAVFPPGVVTEDGWLVDANTRVGAALKLSLPTFPMWVLSIKYGDATAKEREELHALAASCNQSGRNLTRSELKREVRRMIGIGWSIERIRLETGVSANFVMGIRKEVATDEKLKRVGREKLVAPDPEPKVKAKPVKLVQPVQPIPPVQVTPVEPRLTDTQRQALAHTKAQALSDEPYSELVDLAIDAGLDKAEIVEIAKEAKDSGSDEGAKVVIKNYRTASEDRIKQTKQTGQGQRPLARIVRQNLGYFSNHMGEEAKHIEVNPDQQETHLSILKNARQFIDALLVEQMNFMQEATKA